MSAGRNPNKINDPEQLRSHGQSLDRLVVRCVALSKGTKELFS
jgi:hypothetical protein